VVREIPNNPILKANAGDIMSRRRAEIVAFANRLAERNGASIVFRTARKDLVKEERKTVARMLWNINPLYNNAITNYF
jgi:hypothetical protein